MPWDRDSPRGLALQTSGLTRREVLVVSGVAVSGCSAVEELGEAEYERSALDLAVGIACASAESDDVIVTLPWEWDSRNGGSKPDDAVVIEWPDEKWQRGGRWDGGSSVSTRRRCCRPGDHLCRELQALPEGRFHAGCPERLRAVHARPRGV
jgi:hypothetical protein